MTLSLYDENIEVIRQYRSPLLPTIDEARSVRPATDPGETRANAKEAVAFLGDIAKEGVFVIMGVGAGYFLEHLGKKVGKGHKIIVYEPEVGVFKSMLTRVRVANLLSSENVFTVIGDKPEYWFVHHCHRSMINGRLWVIRHKNFTNGGREKCDEFYKRFMDEKRMADINVGTIVGLGKTFMNCILKNTPMILKSQGIIALKGLLKGLPAVVVASGPSIDNQVEEIRRLQGHVALLAVDTSLPFLLSHDIIPTMVLGLDPLDDNNALVKDPRCKDIPLVCLTQYTPELVKSYPGPIFFGSQPGNQITQWLQWFWGEKGSVDCFGGSVSHFAVGLAEYMGASEIALVGHDYCFKSKWYCGDINDKLHSYMGLEVPDLVPGSSKEVDVNGDDVFTKPVLQTFKTAMENWIRAHSHISLVNLSRGLAIEGTKQTDVGEFVDKYTHLTTPLLPSSPEVPCDPTELLQVLVVGRDVFKKIKRTSLRIIEAIHQIVVLRSVGDHLGVRQAMHRIERVRLRTVHPILEIMAGYHPLIDIYLSRQDVRDIDEIEDEKTRQDLRLDRGLNYYGELNEAIGLFLPNINQLIKELRRMKRGLPRSV